MKILRSPIPFLFFSKKEKRNIVNAIRNAEKSTSGEIRVHLAHKVKADLFDHAKKVFEHLGMSKTQQRNGVLIFFNITDRKFVILGDKGINDKVPEDFWNSIVNTMQENFKKDLFSNGICEAIEEIGQKLKAYFPYQSDDVNELSDNISFSWF